MLRIPALALALCFLELSAEVIDRVAVAVGRHVITQSQVDIEVRVTSFLEGLKASGDPAARKAAAGRLIQQTLIRREIELTRFPMPKPEEAAPLVEQARALHGKGFTMALKEAGLQEQDVTDHLLWQLTFLRFVQYRFQPGVSLGDDDVRNYYESQLPRWSAEGKTIAPLETIRKDIEALLVQQRVDQLLERWLLEQRDQTTIVYRVKELAP